MSKTRDTGFLNNVVKTDPQGNVFFVSGSTTLLSISSSGAVTTTGVISGSNALTASYAQNSELLDNLDSTSFVFTSSYNTDSSSVSTRVTRIEGNYATTGSNVFLGAQTVCANITSTGTIVAQTLNVQQVTSSIVYSSGSNTFGNLLTDVQQMTGSLRVTGSATLNGLLTGTTSSFSSIISDGASNEGVIRIERDTVGTNTVIGSLNFTNNNGSTSYGRIRGGRNSAGDGYASIGTGVGDNLYAVEGGNVGIGTSSPASILELCAATPIMTLNQTTGNSNQGINFNNGATTYGKITNNSATGIMTIQNGNTTGDGYSIRFITDGNERLRLGTTGIACFACQVCSPMFLSTGCIGILQYSPETSLDIGNLANQACWSSATSCDANLGENFENNIIIQALHSPYANCAYGYPTSNLVFRTSNSIANIWNVGAIQGVVDPFGGSNYQGGLTFLTKPSANSCDPGGRKTIGGPLVPILTLGQNASNCRIAFFNSSVGIGTATPASPLHINAGPLSSTGTSKALASFRTCSNIYFDICQANAATIAGQTITGTTLVSSDDLAISTLGSERMRITIGGIACFACQVCAPLFTTANGVVVVGAGPSSTEIFTATGPGSSNGMYLVIYSQQGTAGSATGMAYLNIWNNTSVDVFNIFCQSLSNVTNSGTSIRIQALSGNGGFTAVYSVIRLR
jgi:hypothetical protein